MLFCMVIKILIFKVIIEILTYNHFQEGDKKTNIYIHRIYGKVGTNRCKYFLSMYIKSLICSDSKKHTCLECLPHSHATFKCSLMSDDINTASKK